MAPLTSLLLAASAVLPFVVAEPKVVGFDVYKEWVDARDVPSQFGRRSNTVNADLTNELLLYFINVTVGTPGQPFSLQLDTGSSDIWFPSVNSDVCQQNAEYCTYGSYDASASSTYSDPQLPEFQIQYVDGSEIAGVYITDTLNIGSTQVTQMTMAAALEASRGIGIMGIGYRSGESSAQTSGFTYPNVINVLKNEGFINTLAYSLWLNDWESNTGSILFGGVDTDKYHGDLVALPVQPDSYTGTLTSFTVAWTGLKVSGGGQSSDFSPSTAQPAILDCGTTDLLLPDDIATAIYNGIGVTSSAKLGNIVKCSIAQDDLTFAFQFGGPNGPTIEVPLDQFVTPLLTLDGSTPTFDDGSLACTFAIDKAGSNPILFGDAFLRSAYVVYDLEHNVVAIAQTDFNSTSSNVKEITGDIPGVASTASAVTVQQTFTGNPVETATSQPAAATDIGGTSRSATFSLVQATATSSSSGSSGSGSSSTNAAAPGAHVPDLHATTLVFGAVTLICFYFGGSLMLWL